MGKKKVCICGLGYIGLPLAGILATNGYEVVGYDVRKEIINNINSGKIDINEPDLSLFINVGLKSQNFTAKNKPEQADIFIIAVPTPVTDEKKVDLSYVKSAAESIYPVLRKGNLVILESTVPPETTNKVLRPILEKSGLKVDKKELFVAHCPERVLPGRILFELLENDRSIGGLNQESIEKTRELYGSFVKGNMHECDATTAEFVKLIENTFRDVNIALANELSLIAKNHGIDVWKAFELANKHPRVNIHTPGPGVGGHCIPVDPYFLIEKNPKLARLMSLAREINNNMPNVVVDMVKDKVSKNAKVAVFGVAYKPNVEDARESPSTHVIKLLKEDYDVKVNDPYVKDYHHPLQDINETANDSDCLLFLTGHKDYKEIDPAKLKVRNKVVIDTINILDKDKWEKAGFDVVKL